MIQQPNLFTNLQDLQELHNNAVERFHLGDYEKAEELMSIVYALHANIPAAYLKTFGAILQASKNYEHAIHMYKEALEKEKGIENECLFYIGVCLFKLHTDLEAQKYFTQLIQAGHKNSKIISRAKLYLKLIEKRQ